MYSFSESVTPSLCAEERTYSQDLATEIRSDPLKSGRNHHIFYSPC